jgi:nucleotide-binding universal stress UspA family protein
MSGAVAVVLLAALVAMAIGALRSPRSAQRDPFVPTARMEPHRDVGGWSGRAYPAGAVVVGYDGKEHTRGAIEYAVLEASRRDRPLVVLHAVHYPGMVGEQGPGLLDPDPAALEAAEEVTARGVAEARALHPELEIVGATEVTGPVRALRAALPGAELVVVGTRGRGALASRILGARRDSFLRRNLRTKTRRRHPVSTRSVATDLEGTSGELARVHATHSVEPEPALDLPEVWGHGSFPASDPPANW